MHFKDDPISDMHAKNYLIISCLKHFPGPTKFGPVFWSRLFRRGPVEYNYPAGCTRAASLDNSSQWRRSCLIYIPGRQFYSVSCLLLCMLVVYTCGETQALKTGMLTELVIE